MDGRLIPVGLFELSPVWRNFFENIVTVQFDHRLLATLLFLAIPAFWWIAEKSQQGSHITTGLHLLLAALALALQLTPGITTLLLVVLVALAATPQAGAVLLLTTSLYVSHQLRGRAATDYPSSV
jgi:cytochrome c oxidase assembly protein subunit 15